MIGLTKALRRSRAIVKTLKVDESTLRRSGAAKAKKPSRNNEGLRHCGAPVQTSGVLPGGLAAVVDESTLRGKTAVNAKKANQISAGVRDKTAQTSGAVAGNRPAKSKKTNPNNEGVAGNRTDQWRGGCAMGCAMMFTDAYTDRPTTRRGVLVERIRQLKMQTWSEPGDTDTRELLEKAEAELAALDKRSAS